MTEYETGLSAKEREQTTKNLRLASQFIREYLEAPERFDSLPEVATITLLPSDEARDEALTNANSWAVGMPERPGPPFPINFPVLAPERLRMRYERYDDVLTGEFSHPAGITTAIQIHAMATVEVEVETRTAVGYRIPNFLSVVAPKSLTLFDVVLQPTVELVGITREELFAFRNEIAHGRPFSTQGRQLGFVEIVQELALLSA